MSNVVTNWAGNITFGARRLHRPAALPELQEIVRAGGPLRVLGSGHSFNRMADTTGDLVSLISMPRVVEIAADRRTVRVDGGIRYGELVDRLDAEGLAVHNMASLPHISVAGRCQRVALALRPPAGRGPSARALASPRLGSDSRKTLYQAEPTCRGSEPLVYESP